VSNRFPRVAWAMGVALLNIVVGILAQVSPEDAVGNLASWVRHAGFTPPSWLDAKDVDHTVRVLAYCVAAVAFFWVIAELVAMREGRLGRIGLAIARWLHLVIRDYRGQIALAMLVLVAWYVGVKDANARVYGAMAVLAYFVVLSLSRAHACRRDFDNFVRPRSLDEDQVDALIEFFSDRDPFPVTVKVNPLDEEAVRYASQVREALNRTPLTVDFSTSSGEPSTDGTGLGIQEVGSNSRPNPSPRDILRDGLQYARVVTSGGGGRGAGEYKLYLVVYTRPLMLAPRVSPLHRVGMWLIATAMRRQRG
jgi:hypothetical protein